MGETSRHSTTLQPTQQDPHTMKMQLSVQHQHIYCTLFICVGTTISAILGSPAPSGSLSRFSPSANAIDPYEDQDFAMSKRGPVNPGMWFGPRLGRRERRGVDEDAQDEVEVVRADMPFVEMLKDSPWALIALKGGRRHTVNFTPRLGRESSEEDMDDNSGTRLDGRGAPPFAPRLGRRLVPFAPRLGRGDGVGEVIYTPRLGRQQATDSTSH